ncbi:MAG: FtsQ-type POTRA domain-containing protein [Oscillatoriales cyanobacterium C42_A2020_001]|nr:FtsQ-type POTRA domain-containing protein [Leptolyngbyaceae cyanobacterium C42_A2020_001]
MTGNISPISQADLAQRRQRLRRQRRVRFLQTAWRLLAVGGLAGGLVWVTTLPVWLIREPGQIKVEGNRFLPEQTVRALVPITYPQSLLRLEPQAIAQHLQAKAPISEVMVSRQLFPPGLTVRIQERLPVAVTLLTSADAQLLTQKPLKDRAGAARIGLLDESGVPIPYENYTLLQPTVKLPSLRVIGGQEYYRPYWSKLYREISRSPVKIAEIDFQNPANLVLKTELGTVHLGSYGPRFPEQVKTLDRMRKLPNQINLNQIAYIDLRNPVSPVVQINASKEVTKANVP